MHMQIHSDFVDIHLVADNMNACIQLLCFCSFPHVNHDSMLREYKDHLRKAILRNSVHVVRMPFASLTHRLQLLLMLVYSAVALL